MLGGLQELEFDFVADNQHQQSHMDFRFMVLFKYVSDQDHMNNEKENTR